MCGRDAPRERGRPARILIPANSLSSTATPLQGAPSPPLRGSLPSCQVYVRARRPPGARASRPHPYSCKQPPIQGHSPARRAKPAFKGFSSIVPGLVRRDAPRERGRPARILIPANSLPSKATPLQGAPSPPLTGSLSSCQVYVRARRPRSRGILCGRDARVPGGSLLLPRSRSLADPSRFSFNAFVSLGGILFSQFFKPLFLQLPLPLADPFEIDSG